MKRISEIIDEFRMQVGFRFFDCVSNQDNREWVNSLLTDIESAAKGEYKRGVMAGLLLAQTLCNNQIQALINEAEGDNP